MPQLRCRLFENHCVTGVNLADIKMSAKRSSLLLVPVLVYNSCLVVPVFFCVPFFNSRQRCDGMFPEEAVVVG